MRQALLKNESPNQTANNGTPLIIVATQRRARPGGRNPPRRAGAQLDAVDREGYTAPARATEKGDVDIAEILLRRNASPNAHRLARA